jgi:Carbohydrate-selective porin, OprB family/S-layer homology domain
MRSETVRKVDWLIGSLGSLSVLAIPLPGWAQEVAVTPAQASSESPVATAEQTSEVSVSKDISPPEAIDLPQWRQDFRVSRPNDDPMAQVTSVSQLSDVRPGDWAFQALQALVERYGVIVGYPDGTFRGNRPLSRYEFSAALSTVLGKIEEQLLAGDLGGAAQQDVLTIQRLQAAYGTALNDLRTRLDNISDRSAQLEVRQFSTTTKLNGQTILAATNGTDDSLTLVSRTRLNLITSFQGTDRLVAQLEAGNADNDAISTAHNRGQNLLGTAGVLADGGGLDYVNVPREVRLRKLYYVFQPSPSVEVAVGSRIPPSDFIDRNSFANQSTENFASSFFANNPLIVQNELDRLGGAGAAVSWNIRENLTLRALYAAADAATASQAGGGLFGDRYQGTLEVEYTLPQQPIVVRLQYTHAEINGSTINAGGINAEWTIRRPFGVFGRLGFGSYSGFNTALGQELDLTPKTWALGFAVRNFLIPGSKAGIALGQPFIDSKLGNATQTNLEAYFGLLLNDRINFSPSFMVVSNPNNRTSPTIWQWVIRFGYEF